MVVGAWVRSYMWLTRVGSGHLLLKEEILEV